MKLNKEEIILTIGYLQEPWNLDNNQIIILANIFNKLRKQLKHLEDKELSKDK